MQRTVLALVVGALGAAPATAAAPADLPPVLAGCGDGLTQTSARPAVRLVDPVLTLRPSGKARTRLQANHVVAVTVGVHARGGRKIGGTEDGTSTCAGPEPATTAVPLTATGRRLVRRKGRVPVTVVVRAVNGDGIRSTRTVRATLRRPG